MISEMGIDGDLACLLSLCFLSFRCVEKLSTMQRSASKKLTSDSAPWFRFSPASSIPSALPFVLKS